MGEWPSESIKKYALEDLIAADPKSKRSREDVRARLLKKARILFAPIKSIYGKIFNHLNGVHNLLDRYYSAIGQWANQRA